jgi:hypothetical protein
MTHKLLNRATAIELYLKRARELDIIPNFWLAREYLSNQDVIGMTDGVVLWLQEEDWALFPPLPLGDSLEHMAQFHLPPLKIWSDFANYAVGTPQEFLDWEYVYDSTRFHHMDGGEWKTFRKNVRKWPREHEWSYQMIPPTFGQIEDLLLRWLEHKPENLVIQDPASMEWFLMNGTRRAFLFEKDRLMAVNVWDWNDPYLMFRYCVSDPEEPFLNEFARLLFYVRSACGMMVIDGGSLGQPGLERFKDKLNPFLKRSVYTYTIPGGE